MKFTDTVRFTVAVHMEGGEVAKVLMLTKADEVEDITDYLKEIEKESIKDDCIKQGRIEPADAKYLSGNILLEEFEVDVTVEAEVGDGYAEIEKAMLSEHTVELNIEPFLNERNIDWLERRAIEHAIEHEQEMIDDDADRKMDDRRMEDGQ